jgi:3-hydroxybutyryl-CoA dehydratase
MKIEIKGKTVEEIQIGDRAMMSKTITEHDVYSFAGITGDFNPAHIDEEYAKTTGFKTRIAHVMLGASLISAVLGMKLPGPGSVYLAQEVNFKKAVKINDTLTAVVEVIEIEEKSKFHIVHLKTTCYNQNSEIVLDGIAKIIPPK